MLSILGFIVDIVAGLLGGVLLLRFWTNAIRVRLPDQIRQFVHTITDWLVMPLRRVVPCTRGYDWASLIGAFLVVLVASTVLLLAGASGETMLLYAGRGHAWFDDSNTDRHWRDLAGERLAGLDYHSPNMEITRTHALRCSASASDQEGVAQLVLSGLFLGFLPDHYASQFVTAGRMRAIHPAGLRYECHYSVIHRRSPPPLRVARVFYECLLAAARNE